jgi:hypothetical protein
MATVLIVLFGILLPFVTLAIELRTGMCAGALGDPIPTIGHVLLVAFVPLANLAALVGGLRGWTKWRGPLLWSNGAALGIAAAYTLVFLPLAPVAIIAICAMGMGLLPLSPLCSLLAAIPLRMRLLGMEVAKPAAAPAGAAGAGVVPRSSLVSLIGGAALGIALLGSLEARTVVTLGVAEMAASDSPERAARGLGLLRRFASRDELLRMCYEDDRDRGLLFPDRGASLFTGYVFRGLPRADAQKVFFRVTGQPYNALPPPRRLARAVVDEFDFDPEIGGQAVAGRRKGLSLGGSRMDVQVHASAAVSYAEWTLVFQNDRDLQREARAQVLLPPGGVVSRVSLWVNGEPREAAFAGAGQVRAAYQKVAVVQRRDPLLVTWAGSDRVLLQCFPIPPRGEMKIRLGITAPLVLSGSEAAAVRLPCFAERNFSIPSAQIHSLWVESDQPYRQFPGQLHGEQKGSGRHVLRGILSDDELGSADATILMGRAPGAAEAWTPDPKDPPAYVIQKVVARQAPAKRQLVLVIDGSAGMAEHFAAVTEAVAGVAPGTDIRVLVAADAVQDVSAADRGEKDPPASAARLRAVGGVGGCDNVPALRAALEQAAGGGTAIVWVHAPQPVILDSPTPLAHWLERDPEITLYDVAVASGPNQVASALAEARGLQTVPRLGSLKDDLTGLLARLMGQAKEYGLDRTRVEGQPPATPKASSHIARLWAADRVLALVRSGKPADRAEAVKIAAAHQLVTPVSGAVVLETRQQYKEADLEPADPESVPGTPEPSTLALLLATLPGLGWLAWRRRRRACGGPAAGLPRGEHENPRR